jgi:alkanesulfonate monooxygenase SsuD/methylene tetrahydromethanopterin reductase-like flavin-dependent oxidoreductase (luciferase family)
MRYGLSLPNFGGLAHPALIADVAGDAERAGWDGFFLWDHVLLWPEPTVDPWVALSAAAVRTRRIRLGTLVTPLPRRRPIKLAREAVSLDQLSDGRLILGVGSGDGPWEWEYLGEESSGKVRGAMLDEGLALLDRLWSGEPVLHAGAHYRFGGGFDVEAPAPTRAPFLPRPVQRPRIPVWVAGVWPHRPPFRRAARWDGVVPRVRGGRLSRAATPAELREIVAYVRAHRSDDRPFEVVAAGRTDGRDRARDADAAAAHAAAGATWWVEDVSPWAFGWRRTGPWPLAAMRGRVRAGPPSA